MIKNRTVILALLALAACGDNVEPRLTAAQYVYDDGFDQIARDQLYDRALETTCEPTQFSNGAMYCKPPTQPASYSDDKCIHPIGRAPAGTVPFGYFATSYTHLSQELPSQVFRVGAPVAAPTKRWERYEDICVASPVDAHFDYYDIGERVDLATVRLEPSVKHGGFVVDVWRRDDGLRVPARIDGCDIADRPGAPTTTCMSSRNAIRIAYFSDASCTTPVLVSPFGFEQNYLIDPLTGCTQFYGPGERFTPEMVFANFGQTCMPSDSWSGVAISMALLIDGPVLARTPVGATRIQGVQLDDLPLEDNLLHDSALGTDCRRDEGGRCLPATDAKVETWFADELCGTQVDVAMVISGDCNGPATYAQRDSRFYPILAPYPAQLYRLTTAGGCSIYNPPAPFVAHSIGPALGDEAFARATLTIE